MVIDIIEIDNETFQKLTSLQLALIVEAQAKKDEILSSANEKKQKQLQVFLTNNVARSSIVQDYNAKIDLEAERQIQAIREELIYELAFENRFQDGNEMGPYSYPDNPNFNLTPSERFLVVREYYMKISGAQKRFQAFQQDEFAKTYLGEYYQTLYDLLRSYVS